MHRRNAIISGFVFLAIFALLGLFGRNASPVTPVAAAGPTLGNPILFITQVPIPSDALTTQTTFANHIGSVYASGRGGDLWIRYPDGTLKNLTKMAGFGSPDGLQGPSSIAVRDPSVYWDGTKAVFSMAVGAPSGPVAQAPTYVWQLYEVTGLGLNQTPVITHVPNQPAGYNNVSPAYGTDDRIIFVSDIPMNNQAYLYPQLDEYNLFPTNTGLWSLNAATGDLVHLDNSPSGDFTPSVDSFGRVIFTRWDHLERDQEADFDKLFSPNNCKYCTFNYADETISASKLATNTEMFPEPRPPRTDLLAGTNLSGHHMNEFLPWMIDEDGARAETINHIGRHELLPSVPAARTDDPNLVAITPATPRFNQNPVSKVLQIREDAAHPGTYFGVDVWENVHAAGQIISFAAPPGLPADQIGINYITHRETYTVSQVNITSNYSGHYRDPLPMADGTLVAAQTVTNGGDVNIGTYANPKSRFDFRLRTLSTAGNGYQAANVALTNGITRSVSYYITSTLISYNGPLWELNPAEVRARQRPGRVVAPPPGAPEQQILTQAGVDISQLQTYLTQNNLGLAIARNVTTRDKADTLQPFRLQVTPAGVSTLPGSGTTYNVSWLQFFQADLLRGFGGTANPNPGRRVLAQPLHDTAALAANLQGQGGPTGSVRIAADGSMAAFLPARRPMSWQLTDGAGNSIVRERMWVNFQPGEVRVCTSCHGLNTVDQAGQSTPANPPQALLQLLQAWKAANGGNGQITGTAPTISSPLTASANLSAPFNYTIAATGSTPMTFNATGLPAGLSFSGATIVGTPSATGTVTATISATNAYGSDSKTLLITTTTVAPPPPSSPYHVQLPAGYSQYTIAGP